MDTGFAMATAGIAAMMPALPAAFLTVPHLGMPHAHAHPPSLVPPAPPVPLPSIGTLMLAGSVGVLIMGMPAGRCGDLGLAMTCGSLSPAFDVFLGSSNTFIAGNRAARMGDMTRHCNPAGAALAVSRGAALFSAAVGIVGVAADAAGGGPVMGAIAQIAADLAAAAMSALLGKDPGIPPAFGALILGAPTVLIGGFPCPNLPNPLDALMHGLKCLGKAIGKSKGFGKLLNKVGYCNDPSEPIDTFTGEVYNDLLDFHASDSAFVWERHYRSGWNRQDGPLGYGYRHFYQRTLTLLRRRAVYETHDNEIIALERRPDGTFVTSSGFRLKGDGQRFELTTDRDEVLEFEVVSNTTPTSARLARYKREKLDVALFYEANGRLRALTEFLPGSTVDTHIMYAVHGRMEQVQRGVRGQQPQVISSYVYADGCIVEWHDAVGAAARSRYDVARRLVQDTDRRGYSFHWHYDVKSGRCIKSHGDDGLWGVEAKYEGSQSTFKEADGGEWVFKHYSDGTVSHMVDPLGGITEYERDDSGRIVRQRLPGGFEYTWLYNVEGKHTGRRDAFGYWSPPEDLEPNPRNPLDHDGPETQLEWRHGRPLLNAGVGRPPIGPGVLRSIQDARPASARGTPERAPTLDILGRVTEQPHADGSVERFRYDAEGNLVVYQGIKGNWRSNDIISWNKIGVQRSATGYQTEYGYSHNERVTQITDGNGNRTQYVRDKTQRVRAIVVNDAPQVTYIRDAHGSVVEARDGSGKSLVKYETNPLGLHTSAKLADGDEYRYEYDQFGNFSDASSSQHAVTQQHRGRRRTHDLRDGRGVEHSFRKHRLATTTLFDRFTVQYSAENGALRVKTPDGSEHAFWLLDAATVVQKTGNGTYEATVFDSNDRFAGRVCWRDDTDIPHWETRYVYNAAGEMLRAIDSRSGPTQYDYDADSRLVTQYNPDGSQAQYRYDHANNLSFNPSHHHIAIAPGNLVSHTHSERFEYDERARLARRERYDGRSVSYRYDSLGQLVEVHFSDCAQVWRAGYDGLSRRLWREYDGKRTEFYWDGDRLAAEVAPDGTLRLYVYANEDALCPFMWLDYANIDADPASGAPFYLFFSPTGMPLRVENQHRETVWQATRVDAYGAVTIADDAQVDVRLRFAGHFYDEHTELFYNRFRDYDPGLGRYLQPDPLGHAGGVNLYAYASNPVVFVDLRGLAHKKQAKVPMDKQNGTKLPTGEATDPKVIAKRQEELTPRKDLERHKDGPEKGKITKEAAKAECERLLAVRRAHMDEDMANAAGPKQRKELKDKQGPCISATMDRETGEVHHGHNDSRPATRDTKTRVGADRDGKPPDNLHPDLKPRVEHLNDNPRERNEDGKPMSNPGSHAEVHSTNGALQDRAEQNKTRPADDKLPEGKEAMPDLTTVQQPRKLDPDREAPADPTKTKDDMACCPNCSYITHGSDQSSGTNHLAGEDGNPSVPKADGTPTSPVPRPPAPNPPAPA